MPKKAPPWHLRPEWGTEIPIGYCWGCGFEVVEPVGGTAVLFVFCGTADMEPLGDVVILPFEVVPGEMVPLLLGVVVIEPGVVVDVCGVVVVGVVVPFGTVVVVGDVVFVPGVVVPGVVVVVVPVFPMVLLFVVPVTPLFCAGVVDEGAVVVCPVWPMVPVLEVPMLEFVLAVPLCWPPGSGVVGAATGALIVPGVVFAPAAVPV